MGSSISKRAKSSVSPPVGVEALQGSSPAVPIPTQHGGTGSDEQHPNNRPAPVERGRQTEDTNEQAPPAPVTTTCTYCGDVVDEERQSARSRPCKKCKSPACDACLREMFLKACRNEASMPPRCCAPIPLSSVHAVLSADEVALFRDKYEEWSTPNRVYCPIPTCSAFIPPRLLPVAAASPGRGRPDKIVAAGGQGSAPVGVQTPPPTPPPLPPAFPCPKCAVDICGSCKLLAHPDTRCATDSDIDPQLADLLRRWGIKRCPKCRAAVRRMYGCNQMQCRCGAQWCWWCTGPYRICRERQCVVTPEQEAFENELNQAADTYREEMEDGSNNDADRVEEDGRPQDAQLINLDAGFHWETATEDFGSEPEPNGDSLDPFNCTHTWNTLDSDSDDEVEYECRRCWRPLVARPPGYMYRGMQEMFEIGSTRLTTRADDQHTSSDEGTLPCQQEFVNLCRRCRITLCGSCRAVERHQGRH